MASFLLMFGLPMEHALGDHYIQYLLPATIVQAMLFSAMGSSWSIGFDLLLGIFVRWRTLPMDLLAVLVGRIVIDFAKALAALLVLVPIGLALGFRFDSGAWYAVAFVVLSLSFACVGALAFAIVGFRVKDPFSIPGAVMIVYFVLSLLSTAFVPAEQFPGWLQPVVRANPVSIVCDALRRASGANEGSIALAFAVLLPAFAGLWLISSRVLRSRVT